MAVMSSEILDKPTFEAKAASSDMMVVDSETNGHALNTPLEDQPIVPNLTAPDTPALNGEADHPVAELDPVNNFNPLSLNKSISAFSEAPTAIPPSIDAPVSAVRESIDDETEPQVHHVVTPSIGAVQVDVEKESSTNLAESLSANIDPSKNIPVDNSSAAIPEAQIKEPLSNIDTGMELTDRTTEPISFDAKKQDAPTDGDHEMEDAPAGGKVRAREEDDDGEGEDEEPLAKRTKVDELSTVSEGAAPEQPVIPAAASVGKDTNAVIPVKFSSDPVWPSFDAEPITPQQQTILLQRIRNARKIKAAGPFNKPVDYVALNIPNYLDIIKEPMDLGTIENNLKVGYYNSVDAFLREFNIMVRNCYTFNGRDHPVSHLAADLERYVTNIFPAAVDRNGAGGNDAKKPKKPLILTERKETRRKSVAAPPETRSPVAVVDPSSAIAITSIPSAAQQATPLSATATSPTDRFALQPDGTPTIRRDSTTLDGRPKRQIQKPKPKDLPYSVKPKKKKFELELKFCEQLLIELRKKQHQRFVYPFLHPVDPVALNIPHYHKIVKKPMDIQTIDHKLHRGEYSTSKEFKNDFELMLSNCFKFNPETDEVNKMGLALQEFFNQQWETKDAWIEANQPQSEPQSASGDEEEDDAESSEDEATDAQQRDLVAIQQQIAELTNRAQTIIQSGMKRSSPKVKSEKKKAKAGKGGEKKKKGGAAASNAKGPSLKVKKTKAAPVTFAQKQEISESIGNLDENNMRKAVQIIRNGVPSLKGVNDEELEIDMDIIPDDVLRELLKFLRSTRPKELRNDPSDEEYETPRRATKASSTKRKNKPMGKKEQEESIRMIQKQLESFNHPGGSGDDRSPPAARDESSSDDDDRESESEEE